MAPSAAVIGRGGGLLVGNQPSQDILDVGAGIAGNPADDFNLDALADEAALPHPVGRDLLDHGGTLGADQQEPLLRQADEGLAHGLARHPIARGNVAFRDHVAGLQYHADNIVAQRPHDPKRDRPLDPLAHLGSIAA